MLDLTSSAAAFEDSEEKKKLSATLPYVRGGKERKREGRVIPAMKIKGWNVHAHKSESQACPLQCNRVVSLLERKRDGAWVCSTQSAAQRHS